MSACFHDTYNDSFSKIVKTLMALLLRALLILKFYTFLFDAIPSVKKAVTKENCCVKKKKKTEHLKMSAHNIKDRK